MNFRDRKVEVQAGEMIVIPKGVEHKPSSENGYKALLIEPEGVPNTGDTRSERTITKVEWVKGGANLNQASGSAGGLVKSRLSV